MANRRMFSLDVVDTDKFLDLPATSQSLYFHLGMRADDDGFVSSPKRITKLVNCAEDDLNVLISRGFIIPFEQGVIVIRHWKQNNYIRSDRYTPTIYQKELSLLSISNGAYELVDGIPADNQQVDGRDTQYSIGKESKGKNNNTLVGGRKNYEQMLSESGLSDIVKESLQSWIKYKSERRESYKSQGLKALISQIRAKVNEYGENAVCNLIEESMAMGWKGIAWNRLENTHQNRKGVSQDGKAASTGKALFKQ